VGIITFTDVLLNEREFIGSQLLSPLEIGQRYSVSLKVKLCLRTSDDWVNTATNGLGVLFSTVPYNPSANRYMPKNTAHVYSSDIITDSANWTTISGSFIADSAYLYMIVGNHLDDNNVDTTSYDSSSPPNSYYLVDDLVVLKDNSTNNTSQYEMENINIYSNNDVLYIQMSESTESTIEIYNLMGQLIHHTTSPCSICSFDFSYIPDGIYLIRVKTKGTIKTTKIFIK